MTDITKLPSAFTLFSCVVFELNYAKTELMTCAAVHGASEGWEYMARQHQPNNVYVDIERRGENWHVDVITNARGSGRYDCWFAGVFGSLEHAYYAASWLAQHDWKVLRDKSPELNSARRLTADEQAQLASIAPYARVPSLGEVR